MDLNVAVNEALTELVADGTVKGMVRKTLEKAIKEIVDETFGGYRSTFKKELQAHIEKSLAVDLDNLTIPGYNVLVIESIKETLDNVVQTEGINRIREDMIKLLSPLEKSEWKLSEIIEKMKAEANEDDEKWGSRITFEYDDNFSAWSYVYIHPDEGEHKYSCDYHFRIEWFDEKDHSKGGRMIGPKIKEQELDKKNILRGFHGFDDFLFRLYATGATIIADVDHVDVYYPGP
ncbi:hypothetical protein [Paenibacillus sp. HJGM_3]|uniref:hypothetical protein n=1 Tax=Paenibacillus sp. HJGM_3 TaxID=3379816 RepID=UPI00385E1D86